MVMKTGHPMTHCWDRWICRNVWLWMSIRLCHCHTVFSIRHRDNMVMSSQAFSKSWESSSGYADLWSGLCYTGLPILGLAFWKTSKPADSWKSKKPLLSFGRNVSVYIRQSFHVSSSNVIGMPAYVRFCQSLFWKFSVESHPPEPFLINNLVKLRSVIAGLLLMLRWRAASTVFYWGLSNKPNIIGEG